MPSDSLYPMLNARSLRQIKYVNLPSEAHIGGLGLLLKGRGGGAGPELLPPATESPFFLGGGGGGGFFCAGAAAVGTIPPICVLGEEEVAELLAPVPIRANLCCSSPNCDPWPSDPWPVVCWVAWFAFVAAPPPLPIPKPGTETPACPNRLTAAWLIAPEFC